MKMEFLHENISVTFFLDLYYLPEVTSMDDWVIELAGDLAAYIYFDCTQIDMTGFASRKIEID